MTNGQFKMIKHSPPALPPCIIDETLTQALLDEGIESIVFEAHEFARADRWAQVLSIMRISWVLNQTFNEKANTEDVPDLFVETGRRPSFVTKSNSFQNCWLIAPAFVASVL